MGHQMVYLFPVSVFQSTHHIASRVYIFNTKSCHIPPYPICTSFDNDDSLFSLFVTHASLICLFFSNHLAQGILLWLVPVPNRHTELIQKPTHIFHSLPSIVRWKHRKNFPTYKNYENGTIIWAPLIINANIYCSSCLGFHIIFNFILPSIH